MKKYFQRAKCIIHKMWNEISPFLDADFILMPSLHGYDNGGNS